MKKITFLFLICVFINFVIPCKAYASGESAEKFEVGKVYKLAYNAYSESCKEWFSTNTNVVKVISLVNNNVCQIQTVNTGSCDVIAKVRYTAYELQWFKNPVGDGGFYYPVPVTRVDMYTYHITVVNASTEKPKIDAIHFEDGNKSILAGDAYLFHINATSANMGKGDSFSNLFSQLIWKSSDNNVATVDPYGKLSALRKGTCVISAETPEGIKDNVTVTVIDTTGYTAISTKEQLNNIRNDVAAKYYLTNNIVFNKSDFEQGGAFYNNGNGWIPIENFAGTLYGNGFAIRNLKVKSMNAGLFASIASNGYVSDLEISDGEFNGNSTAGSIAGNSAAAICNCISINNTITGNNAGGLIGVSAGDINMCTNTSKVNGITTAGGIVGKHQCDSSKASIRFCKNKGDVFASEKYVGGKIPEYSIAGGIVGYSYFGSVSYCSNSGNVTSYKSTGGIVGFSQYCRIMYDSNYGNVNSEKGQNTTNPYVGGIVGYGLIMNPAPIYDAYNAGSVKIQSNDSTGSIGGVIGYASIIYNNDYYILVKNCYNSGSLISQNNCSLGGIAGNYYVDAGCPAVLFEDCYYSDSCLYSIKNATPPGGIFNNLVKLSLEDMKNVAKFPSFDFTHIWTLNNNSTYQYPQLVYANSFYTLLKKNISFNSQDGSPVSATNVCYGEVIPVPDIPSRTGYTFLGWYKEPECVNAWDFSTEQVTTDIMLYAKWILTPLASDAPKSSTTIPVGITCQITDATLYGGKGTVTITATGGNSGAYLYSIDNGANWQGTNNFSVAAGTHTAAVCDQDNKDNMITQSIKIEQPKLVWTGKANKLPANAKTGTAWVIKPPETPKGYTLKNFTCVSGNKNIAYTDKDGNTTFLKGGKVSITVTTVFTKGKATKTVKYVKQVTVGQLVTKIVLNTTSATMGVKKTLKLKATVMPSSANKAVKWKSSNKKVAVVSNTGVVTAKTKGTAVITCTAQDGSNVSAACTVTVK